MADENRTTASQVTTKIRAGKPGSKPESGLIINCKKREQPMFLEDALKYSKMFILKSLPTHPGYMSCCVWRFAAAENLEQNCRMNSPTGNPPHLRQAVIGAVHVRRFVVAKPPSAKRNGV